MRSSQSKGRGRAGSQQRQGSGQKQLPHAQTSSETVRRPGQPAAPTPSTSGGRGVHHGERGDAAAIQLGRGIEKLAVSGDGGGDADASQPSRRGMSRGKRMLSIDVLKTRPATLESKKGTTGQLVTLHANYFKLLKSTDWSIHQYCIDFKPEEDRTQVRKGLLRPHKNHLGNYIYDGSVMYTSVLLPKDTVFTSKRDTDNEIITLIVNRVGDLMTGDAHQLQFFNIIMRKCYENLNLNLIGRNYFDQKEKIIIPSFNMEVWPGYISSIRQHENDYLMCVEITSKVMRLETVYDIFMRIRREYGDRYRDAFVDTVVGSVVLTTYNNNTYIVDDVDFKTTPKDSFTKKNGEKITYMEYYRTKVPNYSITDPNQPMLISKAKVKVRQGEAPQKIYLVPQLCNATGLTDSMRDNYKLMAALAEHTRLTPQNRCDRLLKFNKRLNTRPEIVQEFKDWNLQLDNKLLEIPGRILPPETLTFGKPMRQGLLGQIKPNNGDWTREMQNMTCFLPCLELKDWVVITTDRDRRDVAENFIPLLQRVAKGIRFLVAQPTVCTIADDRANTYNMFLENLLSKRIPQLVFCIASNNRNDRYSAIKKKCCVDRPVPSQVCLMKTIRHKNVMSIATKIAIQMNCKLGGAPWTIDMPLDGLMTVGFDVSHDTMEKSKDFGAMVASLDKQLTRYFSTVSAHSDGDELSKDLCKNIVRAVQAYTNVNKTLPTRIIIYRDGVGEGQLPQVMEREVKEIRRALNVLYKGPSYKLAFVVVTKRLNTRLFYNKGNPPPGTIVDDIITSPIKYDFFIVSQQVRQGTVTPTAYNILDSDFGLSPDKMQRLTYKLTHMYFNCSNTVRVPAPCHYAHKLAFLISRYVHRAPENHLQNMLYFL